MGKAHRLPCSSSTTVYSQPLELIHADVWGPAPIESLNGYSYFVHFVDEYTKFTWLYLVKHKSEVLKIFTQFKANVELQFNTPIKILQTNGGGEYTALNSILTQPSITHRISCPFTPQQNGTAERKIRHITYLGLSMLAHASMPLKFWHEAFLTVVHIINRLPTPNLQNYSPFFLLYKSPSYSHMRVFGCASFPNLRPYNKQKFKFRSLPCVLLGYSEAHKDYRCLSSTGRIYFSKDVLFDETSFPFKTSSSFLSSSSPSSISSPSLSPSIPIIPSTAPTSSTDFITTNVSSAAVCSPVQDQHTQVPSAAVSPSPSSSINPITPNTGSSSSDSSTRYMIPRAPLPNSNTHPMLTRRKHGITEPKIFIASKEPSNVKEALTLPQWKTNMMDEFTALTNNNTWEIVPLPQGKTAVGCKWLFRLKQNPDGSINRHKARLVAKGFHQKPRV